MKKKTISFALVLSSFFYAQNVFPTTGNVGIGTDTPTKKLDVNGVANVGGLNARNYLSISSREWPEIRFTSPVSSEKMRLGIAHTSTNRYGIEEGDLYVYSLTSNSMPLQVKKAGAVKLNGNYFNRNGKVGIGTDNPIGKLHLKKASGTIYSLIQSGDNFFGLGTTHYMDYGPAFVFNQNSQIRIGTASSISASGAQNFKELMRVNNDGNFLVRENVWAGRAKGTEYVLDKGTFGEGRGILLGDAGYIFDNNDQALNMISRTALKFYVDELSKTAKLQMTITRGGKVGIGTATPTEKLTVNGMVYAKEVKVDTKIPADYVFEKYYEGVSSLNPEYKMPTLEEVENFTKEYKHLPEIPSAKEIQEKGLELGEMANLLLQKIEELTLYTIEQQKQLKRQNEELQNQKEEIRKLKQKIKD